MKVDWLIQSVMLISILVMVAIENLFDAQTVGLILLVWQFISALIVVIKMQGRHVPGHFTFLALLIGFCASANIPVHMNAQVVSILIMTIPWTLILYYWILTTVSVARKKDHRGKFLPHIGF
jgi:prepilin signal peptidase PulO-like enzyme (type II secretory pathway)